MRVQQVILKDSRKRYLLVDEIGTPIPVVAKYLKYLDNTGKSVNTQKTYCYALKTYYDFLEQSSLNYQHVILSNLADFMGWLRAPEIIGGKVVYLQTVTSIRTEKTCNLILSAVCSFYDYLYRNQLYETALSDSLLKAVLPIGQRRYKDFLYHVNKSNPIIRNILKMKEPTKKIPALSKSQVEEIYAATTNIRDRFLVKLLFETGFRIGEALSLFVEDFLYDIGGAHKIRLVRRGELVNGARLKSGEREIHISSELMNLYDDYMYTVLDEIDVATSFIFVKLRGENRGNPMTYSDVAALFKTLRLKTDLPIHPHLLRHTHATMYYRNTKDIKQVQERLGHAQIQTTLGMYLHPSDDELREDWERAQPAFQIMEDE